MSGADFNTYKAILLGAQAAGVATNLFAESRANKTSRLGYDIDQRELQLRMQEEELAFTQANTANLERLRETLSTQNAILGARNQLPGQGSALAIQNKSLENFSADKTALRLSQAFRKSQLKGLERLAGIKQASSRIESGNKLLASGLNMFNANEILGKSLKEKSEDFDEARKNRGGYDLRSSKNYISKSSRNR